MGLGAFLKRESLITLTVHLAPASPLLVFTTVHNVGGLACILWLTNSHNQSPKLPRNVAPRDP